MPCLVKISSSRQWGILPSRIWTRLTPPCTAAVQLLSLGSMPPPMKPPDISSSAWQSLLHTYNRYQIVIEKGKGVYLYDTDGIKYLDFVSGIAVFALGYGNKEYNDALKAQIDKVIHTSNYYYNMPAIRAAKKLKEVSGMDRVFFTNSGAEAVEGAIKAARKYAYLKDGTTDHEIIAMEHSFHGRTFGALSVTGTPKYREPFEPMIGNYMVLPE